MTNRVGLIAIAAALALASCERESLSARERAAISREIHAVVMNAYDLTKPGTLERLLSLYPDSGRVYSAGGGRFTASRDTLRAGIREFWESVGRNMQQPRWEWTAMHVDALAPDVAVMTATYRVPHRTPRGEGHVIAGAWTATFVKRGGRWVILHEHLSDNPADTGVRSAPHTAADAHAGH